MQRITAVSYILLSLHLPASAANIENAKVLHQENCTRCHPSGIYTRPYRFVKNLEQLRAQVKQCERMLGLDWSAEIVDDVAEYLNTDFYRFKSNPKVQKESVRRTQ